MLLFEGRSVLSQEQQGGGCEKVSVKKQNIVCLNLKLLENGLTFFLFLTFFQFQNRYCSLMTD